jgi:hypothetical protein
MGAAARRLPDYLGPRLRRCSGYRRLLRIHRELRMRTLNEAGQLATDDVEFCRSLVITLGRRKN